MSKATDLADEIDSDKYLEDLPWDEISNHLRALDESHRQLLGALESVLMTGRGPSGRIILNISQEPDLRASIAAAKELS